jgi:hypothetical protein
MAWATGKWGDLTRQGEGHVGSLEKWGIDDGRNHLSATTFIDGEGSAGVGDDPMMFLQLRKSERDMRCQSTWNEDDDRTWEASLTVERGGGGSSAKFQPVESAPTLGVGKLDMTKDEECSVLQVTGVTRWSWEALSGPYAKGEREEMIGGESVIGLVLELGGGVRYGMTWHKEREGGDWRHRPRHGGGSGMWAAWQRGTGELGP